MYIKRVVTIVVAIVILFTSNLVFASSSPQTQTKPDTSYKLLFADNGEQSSLVKIQNEFYLPMGDLLNHFKIHYNSNTKNKGIFILDPETKSFIYLLFNENSIMVKKYTGVKQREQYLPIFDLNFESENVYELKSPLIFYNNKSYLSMSFLQKYLKMSTVKDDVKKSITVSKNIPEDFNTFIGLEVKKLYEEGIIFDFDIINVKYEIINDYVNSGTNDNETFEKLKEYSNMLYYKGKTFWLKTSCFFSVNEDDSDKVYSKYKDTAVYVKLAVNSLKYNDELITLNCIIDNVKYNIDSTVLDDLKYLDILTTDPKTTFGWSNDIWRKFLKYDIWIGMTDKMAIVSAGNPSEVNRTVSGKTVIEQWVYDFEYGKDIYLYFKNGILTSYQN